MGIKIINGKSVVRLEGYLYNNHFLLGGEREMDRELLEGIGLTDEQIEFILEAYEESIKDKDSGESDEEVALLQEQLKEKEEQIEELSKLDGKALEQRVQELEEENKSIREESDKELNQYKLDVLVERYLDGVKAKNHKAVLALIDIEQVVVNEDGELEGLEEQVIALQESDPYLFEKEEKEEKKKKITTGSHGKKEDNKNAFGSVLLG